MLNLSQTRVGCPSGLPHSRTTSGRSIALVHQQSNRPQGQAGCSITKTWLRRSLFAVLWAAQLLALSAWAGFVTTDEAGMDAIFSQSSFHVTDPPFQNTPIDIRFNPAVVINNPSLLNIDSDAKLQALFNLGPADPLTVDVFFVDEISFCAGVINIAAIGCGQQPGHQFALESLSASGSLGDDLLAHELGHNLNLPHVDNATPNLMNPSLLGETTLTPEQVSIMLASPLVQTDNGQRFISITPFAVVVPEPGTVTFVAGLAILGVLLATRKAMDRKMGSRSHWRQQLAVGCFQGSWAGLSRLRGFLPYLHAPNPLPTCPRSRLTGSSSPPIPRSLSWRRQEHGFSGVVVSIL